MGDGSVEYRVLERILARTEDPRNLPLETLKSITKEFSEDRIIGSGGSGVVYKGVLPNGTVIAVKRMTVNSHTLDDKSFDREVKSLLKVIDHPNVVRFLGFCYNTSREVIRARGSEDILLPQIRERLLCFDYISNGSLDKYITDELRGLDWNTRYQIIKGICEGLQYLHNKMGIIHMDLKPANIMVDNHMVPKITDFGLARPDGKSVTTGYRFVSQGYSAPEYENGGDTKFQCDIYSLGVIINELVTGRKGKGIPDKNSVIRRWRHRWRKSTTYALGVQEITKCVEIAERCTQEDPRKRPSISNIIQDLNESAIFANTNDMLGIEPLELWFPFEMLNKEISNEVVLTNETDNCIAFNIKASRQLQEGAQPNKGIVLPRSKNIVNITLQAKGTMILGSMPRADEFIVQSTQVVDGLTDEEITEDMFDEEAGKVVDEVNLTVVYDNWPEKPQADQSLEDNASVSKEVSACRSLETKNGGDTNEQMSQQHASEPAKHHDTRGFPATWEDATTFPVPVFSGSIEDKSHYTSAMPRILTFQLLYDITKGFSIEHKIGHGSFGEVYKGELPNGEKIAVKKLRENLMLVNDMQFKNEVHILENLKHHNIVQFVGYCHETQPVPFEINGKVILAERQQRTLCFEYLQNGSLKTHLSEVSCGLNWKTRYEIIKGICEGLNYLHNGSEDGRPIYHMDLKPDNILLDENMVPKIADFGLSRLFSTTQSQTTKTSAGTLGYMPPEYIDTYKISNKFDVFSLGVIIIDIMIGPSSCRVEYGETSSDKDYSNLVQENWNRRLKATPSCTSQETDDSLKVKTCIEIALKCLKKYPAARPTISMIVDTLKYIHNAQRSLFVDQARLVKFGLWGSGRRGSRRDIKTAPRRLESVTIYSLDVINALEFSYTDCNAQHYTAGPWGGIHGSANKIQLHPSEVLVELCGTVGPTNGIPNVITSLMLITDADRYGPFGREDGTTFRICMQNNGHIAGFFARADEYVNAVGVYANQEESRVGVCKVGPWGGEGGSTCDIDVPPHRVHSVTVRCIDHVIHSLAFSYSDCNGQHHTAGPWGGIIGEEHKIDLEPYEFLVKVSGTIGEFGGIQNLITSLTMVTNVATYGPFGEVRGTHFDIPVHSKSCIVGFFGRAGIFVNAIGVYARPI